MPIESPNLGESLTVPAIKRSNEAHLMSRAGQEFSQRPHHVGESAGFGVGKRLAAREQDFHY